MYLATSFTFAMLFPSQHLSTPTLPHQASTSPYAHHIPGFREVASAFPQVAGCVGGNVVSPQPPRVTKDAILVGGRGKSPGREKGLRPLALGRWVVRHIPSRASNHLGLFQPALQKSRILVSPQLARTPNSCIRAGRAHKSPGRAHPTWEFGARQLGRAYSQVISCISAQVAATTSCQEPVIS